MYMKSDGDVYLKCTSMGQGVMRRLERDPRAYCGVCHAGVKEYVCPIWSDGRLIGSVNAGVFAAEKRYVRRYLERVCRKSHLEVERALELYETCISASRVDEERLFVNLEMIANAFSLIFARVNVHGEYVAMRPSTVIMHNSIISDALEYLKQNYLEDLHASDVAAYCHCSISCLSHLFIKPRRHQSASLYRQVARGFCARGAHEFPRTGFRGGGTGGVFRSQLFFSHFHPIRRPHAQPISQTIFPKIASKLILVEFVF